MSISTWPTEQPKWNTERIKKLLEGRCGINVPCEHHTTTTSTNLKEIIEKSKKFFIKFPIVSMTCQNILKFTNKETLERNINSAYPIIHEHSLYLYTSFLIYKQKFGSDIEKTYYKDKTVKDLINKFLYKRAVTFMGKSDTYLLRNGTKGFNEWQLIGKNVQKPPLTLDEYLSYDEIKLSALLSISSYSYFINDGNRFNNGVVVGNRKNIENEGIIIGLIGTRFEKEHVMEYEEIIISRQQNTTEKGYGIKGTDVENKSIHKLFADFYDEDSFGFNDERIKENRNRFLKVGDVFIFDSVVYSKRLSLSFDTLLLEANHRAKERKLQAYIHVVGIGLGVWKISSIQTKLFMETFGARLLFLGNNLPHVSDVHFSYISGAKDCAGYTDGQLLSLVNHPNNGIKIHISKREPFTKLQEQGKLLVVCYAWDGNSFPGNEFWMGMLTSTGDSAAAASTQITELHNPYINNLINADNLMVAQVNGSVIPYYKFVEKFNTHLLD